METTRNKGTPMPQKSCSGTTITERQVVRLLSFDDGTSSVAQGQVIGVNPDLVIGGGKLGSAFYVVCIGVAIKPEEQLVRPFDNYQIIEDAIGSIIAWPKKLLIVR